MFSSTGLWCPLIMTMKQHHRNYSNLLLSYGLKSGGFSITSAWMEQSSQKVPKLRTPMARLWTSGHSLAIETGSRFHKPRTLPVPERLCARLLKTNATSCVYAHLATNGVYSAEILSPVLFYSTAQKQGITRLQTCGV